MFLTGNVASVSLYAAPTYVYINPTTSFLILQYTCFHLCEALIDLFSSMLIHLCHCRVTFKRVIRKKSTEEFSCFPYIIALLNCLLFTWYGLPVISYKWENFPLVTVNGVGVVLELSYVLIYFWYSSAKGKASCVIF